MPGEAVSSQTQCRGRTREDTGGHGRAREGPAQSGFPEKGILGWALKCQTDIFRGFRIGGAEAQKGEGHSGSLGSHGTVRTEGCEASGGAGRGSSHRRRPGRLRAVG